MMILLRYKFCQVLQLGPRARFGLVLDRCFFGSQFLLVCVVKDSCGKLGGDPIHQFRNGRQLIDDIILPGLVMNSAVRHEGPFKEKRPC